jgi:hypothetical protein
MKTLGDSRGIALLCFRPRHWKGVRGQREYIIKYAKNNVEYEIKIDGDDVEYH